MRRRLAAPDDEPVNCFTGPERCAAVSSSGSSRRRKGSTGAEAELEEKEQGAPGEPGTPCLVKTGRRSGRSARDHGAIVNWTAFDRLLVDGAGGSRNQSWALNTSPAKAGLPIADGWVAR